MKQIFEKYNIDVGEINDELAFITSITADQKVLDAFNFAMGKHKGQTRKNGDPFIWHPLRIVKYVDVFCSAPKEKLMIVALLHDVVEETDASLQDINNLFGKEIAEAVKYSALPADCLKRGKEKFYFLFDHVFNSDSQLAKVVKVLDRIDNLKSYDVIMSKSVQDYLLEAQCFLGEALKINVKLFDVLSEIIDYIKEENIST